MSEQTQSERFLLEILRWSLSCTRCGAQDEKRQPAGCLFSLGFFGRDVDKHALMQLAVESLHLLGEEVDHTGCGCEEGIVLAASDILSRMEFRAALANQDGTDLCELASIELHAKTFGYGITPQGGRASRLFMGHMGSIVLKCCG